MPSINIYPTSPNHVTSTALTSAHQGSMVVLVSRRISVWSEIHEIGISLGAIDSAHLYINKNKYDWCPFNICYHYYTSTSEVTAGLPHFLCLPAIDDQPIRRQSMARCWVNTPPRGFRRARGTWGPYRWAAEMVKPCGDTNHGTNWQIDSYDVEIYSPMNKNQFTMLIMINIK